jgi:hypothetical protein
VEMMREMEDNWNGWWGNSVWWWFEQKRKCLWSVSDMKGELSLWISLYYDLLQGFYTMLWVPYGSVLFAYLQREWEDGHTKIRKGE